VGKSGVLEHKSGNISETRKDRGKFAVDSNALSNGTIPTPYGIFFRKIGGLHPPPKTPITIISGLQIWLEHS